MLSSEPVRLTDCLWLAAHDTIDGKACIGEWSLGVGLATGLLGELIHGGCLEVRGGDLFRIDGTDCGDPALQPVLETMRAEEDTWAPTAPPPALPRPRPQADSRGGWGQPYSQRQDIDWPIQAAGDRACPPRPAQYSPWPHAPGGYGSARPAEQVNHRRRGHDLRQWLSYLAYEQRAETRVVDRLARIGLVRREERRRLLRSPALRYVPCDSVVAGTPASLIRGALESDPRLGREQLLLAGLFLATGLHHYALETLSAWERSRLTEELKAGLDDMSRELLRAADAAIGEAAMR